MAEAAGNKSPGEIPSGYQAISALPQQQGPLRVCVLVRQNADPIAGQLILLRDSLDAKAYLGCLVDAAGKVQRWVELWVQDHSGVELTALARESLTSKSLDDRWKGLMTAFEAMDASAIIRTGWEATHPPALYLDLAKREPFVLAEPDSGAAFALCTDDALLAQRELPTFSGSTHRYLYVGSGDRAEFIPIGKSAPRTPSTREASEFFGGRTATPFNPGGGFMMVRAFHPLPIDNFADLLSGAPWRGLPTGKAHIDPAGLMESIKTSNTGLASGGRLLLAHDGPAGRLVETLHLKLRLIADAIQGAARLTQRTQRPLMNIAPESFSVSFAPPQSSLPFLWTSQVHLNNPGDAISLTIPGSASQYYLPARNHLSPIYRPPVSAQTSGRGSVRVPKIQANADGSAVLEITFTTHERVDPKPNDLFRLRLNLGQSEVDLFARVEPDASLAPGEFRFRTLQQKFHSQALSALQASEGAEIPGVVFELIPLLSSPCDLFSLAVLSVRVLLVNSAVTLPVALDKMLSLARHLSEEQNRGGTLGARIDELFRRDARWRTVLGPQQLMHDPTSSDVSPDVVPPSLWADALAAILPMFPGTGRDAIARDFGDAPPTALHRVYDRPLAELESLLRRTRSLLLADWRLNREVHSIIDRLMAKTASPAARPAAALKA